MKKRQLPKEMPPALERQLFKLFEQHFGVTLRTVTDPATGRDYVDMAQVCEVLGGLDVQEQIGQLLADGMGDAVVFFEPDATRPPETPKEVDAVLRAAGHDPEAVAARMRAAAARALARAAQTMPQRIYWHRFMGVPLPPNTRCVGRGSRWGNPFLMPPKGPYTREAAVVLFAEYADLKAQWDPEWLPPLRGQDLTCCPLDQKCHADVLLQLANRD